ncbi:hypothetical protein Ddye_023304 [Dipteronia dyeriana]|uniref:RNase H type-1 domain-containing protein n=1 Tax=Dipteronia dyeriana TaxID=168575 RepID=A0AAD9TTA9_9ROSI|nr:hypothetical protein Ddye_023304 [Dipteronia dyeriana]
MSMLIYLLDWSSSHLDEFQGTKKVFLSSQRFPLHSRPPDWLSPPVGLLKQKSNVAVRAGCNEIGLGVAIRDASDRVVAAISKFVVGNVIAELGELLALREGLLLAKSFNPIIWVVEVDASNVASMLNSDVPSLSDTFFLINDIKALCKVVGDCRCQAISRLGNSLVHQLAAWPFPLLRDKCGRMLISFVSFICL